MPITSLRFTNVGPFDDIEFEFDPQVNVFTGPNNSGKSTVLWVLGEIMVYPFEFPTKLLRSTAAECRINVLSNGQEAEYECTLPVIRGIEAEHHQLLGTETGPFGRPNRTEEQYIRLLKTVGYSGFIPALRRSTDFRAEGPVVRATRRRTARRGRESEPDERDYLERDYLARIPGRLRNAEQLAAAERAMLTLWARRQSNDPELLKRGALISTNASLVSDEAVIQKIIELDYTAYRRRQPAIRGVIERIASISSEITEGFPIQFLGVAEDEGGLYPQFRTPDGDTSLNVLSQGTQSIIQWLAYLLIGYAEYYSYPPNLEEKPGILIIDELDAHLHPSWQRRIIPTLLKHFPNLQIFCSTHSPLMLAGLKAGQVQLLRRDDKGKVTVSRSETDIVGWSADEILRNFLDVPSPTDLGTVKLLNRLQELQHKESLSEDEAAELEPLRHTVSRDLLSGPIAGQVDRLADMLKQIKAEFAAHPEQPASAARPGATRRRSRPAK